MVHTVIRTGVVAALLVGVAVAAGGAVAEESEAAREGTALLVIDIQAFYFANGTVPLVGPDEASL